MKTKKSGVDYSRWGYIFLAPFFITFSVFAVPAGNNRLLQFL